MKVCLECKHIFNLDGWTCPVCGYKPNKTNGIETHAPESTKSGGGFKPEYFSKLFLLEAENFWFRARNELILWALKKYKKDVSSFLEVGCGTGFVLSGVARTYPDIAISGSEIFIAGLSHAAERLPTAHLMQMDARRVPFANEFDVIGAFDVLEHIEEDEIVLEQLHNAIKPDGILLLTVPQHPWLWSDYDEHACHVRRYTCAEIEQKVSSAGFELIKSSSFVTTLLPAMMISRVLQKNTSPKKMDPARELKINPLLNKVFYSFMKLEIFGIRFGINFPVGGSRLLVARKMAK